MFGIDTALVAVVLAAVLLLLAGLLIWRRVAASRGDDRPVPLIVFAPTAAASPGVSHAWRAEEPFLEESILEEPVLEEPVPEEPVREEPPPEEPHRRESTEPEDAPFDWPGFAPSRGLRVLTGWDGSAEPKRVAPPDTGNLAAALEAEALPAPDGTLQLLPGRLVPLNSERGEEIRFVRGPGVNRFTIGRSTGPPHAHIQLRAPTVSRMHACMVFENGRWSIGNLSATNPVVVNGSKLPVDGALRLQDDDRLEFGELAFTFRSR